MADEHKPDDPEEGGAGNRRSDRSPDSAGSAAGSAGSDQEEAESSDSDADADAKDAEADADAKDADAKDADEPAAEHQGPGEPPSSNGEPPAEAAAWGRPLARLDHAWTTFEAYLCAIVLLLEVISLSLWVVLKGMASPPDSGNMAGVVLRGLLGAVVLGTLGYMIPKKWGTNARRIGASIGFFAGFLVAKLWARVGIDYSSNLLNWFQQASALTLLGGLGLRDVGKRLTLLLALLGGSLATAAGKHITIDLITRFLKPKARLPVVVVGWVGASLICFTSAWGFFDHIAIEGFGAPAEATAGQKLKQVAKGLDEDWFILRKQVDLDFTSFPHVVKGQTYSDWLTGKEWNAWLDSHGFVERYGKDKVKDLRLPEDAKRSPIVVVPDLGEPRGELVSAANLVFPFGLFIIAVRFLLLTLLAISGHMSIEPEAEGADIRRDAPHDGDPLEGDAP